MEAECGGEVWLDIEEQTLEKATEDRGAFQPGTFHNANLSSGRGSQDRRRKWVVGKR